MADEGPKHYPSDPPRKKRVRKSAEPPPHAAILDATRYMRQVADKDPSKFTAVEDMSLSELLAAQTKLKVKRDRQGRFEKGTPSPNPRGAPRKQRRMYGMAQTVQDTLELFEQPVLIKKGDREEYVPAIVAIANRLIHLAAAGDMKAIIKCLELRERYSAYREKVLHDLMESALELRGYYRDNDVSMPPHIEEFLAALDQHVLDEQFRAG